MSQYDIGGFFEECKVNRSSKRSLLFSYLRNEIYTTKTPHISSRTVRSFWMSRFCANLEESAQHAQRYRSVQEAWLWKVTQVQHFSTEQYSCSSIIHSHPMNTTLGYFRKYQVLASTILITNCHLRCRTARAPEQWFSSSQDESGNARSRGSLNFGTRLRLLR